jgi:hypothetical protein
MAGIDFSLTLQLGLQQKHNLYCFKTPKIQEVRGDYCYNVFRKVVELIFAVVLARARNV